MFSRSKSKRFVDAVSCAPPPGHYSIKENKIVNLASFQKSQRWKDQSSITNNSCESITNCSSNSIFSINKSFIPKLQSSVKKKSKTSSNLKIEQISDSCRKSLVADVEFQQSKVNALLEKIKSLEIQVEGSKSHSLDIEKSNEKLHEIINELRQEKCSLVAQNQTLEERIQLLNQEKLALDKDLAQQNLFLRKFEGESELYSDEKEKLMRKLNVAQELNCDFREQLESVESTMTDNLHGITEKYENLEETLDSVRSDYKMKLERSNSLVEKMKEAQESSEHDLQVMQEVYDTLKEDHDLYKIEVLRSNGQYEEVELKLREEIKGYIAKLEEITESNNATTISYQEEKEKKEKLADKVNEQEENFRKLSRELNEHRIEYQTLLTTIHDVNIKLATNVQVNADLKEELKRSKSNQVELQKQTDAEKTKHLEEVKAMESEVGNGKAKSKSYETEISRLQKTLRDQEKEYKNQNDIYQQNLFSTQSELETAKQQLTTLQDNPRTFDEAKIQELQQVLQRWQDKYGDLESKVGPFMSQLEQFELEKQSLLCENAFTQSEMSKLSDKYAQILGHQNNKQKIHHIRKLKEENLSLKADAMKLRADLTREKKRKHHADSKNVQQNKIDHSKAIHHEGKENMLSREPLKPSNS